MKTVRDLPMILEFNNEPEIKDDKGRSLTIGDLVIIGFGRIVGGKIRYTHS